MFVIEPKSTVKYLAVVEAVISFCFLLFIIIFRIFVVTAASIAPQWVDELNDRHWRRNRVCYPGCDNSWIWPALLSYYAVVAIKVGLAVYLWRSVPKDYYSRNSRRLLYWVWFTIAINFVGIGLLYLLGYAGAFEVTLCMIFSILTCILDLFCIGSVLWLRRIIQLHVALGTGPGSYMVQGIRAENGATLNPNHNLKPCTIF